MTTLRDARDTEVMFALGLTFAVCLLFGALIGLSILGVPESIILLALGAAVIGLLYTPRHNRRSVFLMVGLLFLFAYPTARFLLGNVPVYVLDIILGILLLSMFFRHGWMLPKRGSALWITLLLLFLLVPSTVFSYFYEYNLTNVLLEPTYMLVRTMVSISISLLIPSIIDDQPILDKVMWCLAVALLLTSIAAIINAVFPVGHPLFQLLEDLTPTRLGVFSQLYELRGSPVRVRGLFVGPNHLGGALLILWSFVVGRITSKTASRQRPLLLLALATGTTAVFLTYTRSTYIGLALAVIVLLLNSTRSKHATWILLMLSASAFALVSAGIFNIEFIEQRFEVIEEQPEDRGTEARVLAYTQAPGFLLANPQFFFVGRGFAVNDMVTRGVLPAEVFHSAIYNTENHSVLIMTMYQRGLLSTIALVLLWILSFAAMWRVARIRSAGSASHYRWLAVALQMALAASLPGVLLDHYFVSTIYMQSIMYSMFGFVLVTLRLAQASPSAEAEGAVDAG